MRRRRLVLGAAVAAVAGLGLGLWFGLARGGKAEPTPSVYAARVSAACRSYARRLERVPAPSDPSAYGDVIGSLERVLPLLRRQKEAMRAVPPPRALAARLDRLFELDSRSIAELERVLAAARQRRAGGVATGLVRFVRLRDRVHAAAVAVGIDCTVN